MLSIFRVINKLSSSHPQFDFICFVSVIESNTQFVLQGKQIKPEKVDSFLNLLTTGLKINAVTKKKLYFYILNFN